MAGGEILPPPQVGGVKVVRGRCVGYTVPVAQTGLQAMGMGQVRATCMGAGSRQLGGGGNGAGRGVGAKEPQAVVRQGL